MDAYKKESSDSLIVINGFANTKKKVEILIECIKQLQKAQHEILLVAQYPVSKEIQSMVNYYIYDCRDPKAETGGEVWFQNSVFRYVTTKDITTHSYAVFVVLKHGTIFAKNLGKKYMYYFDYDVWIAETDLLKLDKQKNILKEKNLFGAIDMFVIGRNDDEMNVTVTNFIIDVDYFYNKIHHITNINKYYEFGRIIEIFLYNLMKDDISNFLILSSPDIPSNEGLTFTDSILNIATSVDSDPNLHYMLASDNNGGKYLVLMQEKSDSETFKVTFDDDDVSHITLNHLCGHYIKINDDISKINIKVCNEDANLDLDVVEANIIIYK